MDLHTLARDLRFGVLATAAGAALVTGAMAPFQSEIGLLNEGLALLLLTLVISATWGWQVGLFAAVLTNLTLNFFFVEPLHTFTVRQSENVGALGVFLIVSVIAGSLLSRARAAAATAERRQAETEVLLQLSRELIGRADPADALAVLCDNVLRAFDAPGAGVLSPAGAAWNVLAAAGGDRARRPPDGSERLMARHAIDSGALTWLGHTGLGSPRRLRMVRPGSRHVTEASEGVAFVPLLVGQRPLGVLRLDGPIGAAPFREHPQQLLEAFAREAALGVQRLELAQAASHADALRQAGEFKTALLASISHDVKTPLAGIKAAASSLLDRSVAWSVEDVQSFLETIDSQADRLNRVTSDVLDLSRIESGVVKPVRRTLAVSELLSEAAERAHAATAGRSVTVDAPDTLVVAADESLTIQALVNLIENAAKYSVAGGAICLVARRAASGVEIAVADEGPGIAAQDLPYVFERFYRAGEHSRRVRGSGLGLAIVKGFIAASGGAVRVESAPQGTRFVITLPAPADAGAA